MLNRTCASTLAKLFLFSSLVARFPTDASRIDLSPTKSLAKRSMVLECPNDKIPKSPNLSGAIHPFVRRFTSLHDLCSTYTTGMGFVCGPNGVLLVGQPFSPMWLGPPDSSYLRRACFDCHCTNIAPDEPDPPAVERPVCVVDVEDDEVEVPVPSYPPNPQCGVVTGPYNYQVDKHDLLEDRYQCNEYMYGRPIYADCEVAVEELERYQDAWEAAQPADDLNDMATFVGIGRMADFKREYSADYDGDNPNLIQLPVTQTNGTCTISIMQLERRDMDMAEQEYWNYLFENAWTVIGNCVESQGIGGWIEAGDRPDTDEATMGVFIHGPNARFQRLLDIKLACTSDAEGNADCQDIDDDDDDDQWPRKKQKSGEWSAEGQGDAGQGGSSDPQPPATQQCEVPCSHPSDCDTTNNYLCTSTSPLPEDPPIDPSFRAFCCQLVTELSDSIAASQALGPSNCRDRCLLTNTTTNATTATNGTTWTNTTLEILAQPDRPYPGLALECPCNCTYVSPACCLSTTGVVFEDASKKSAVGVRAPNGTVCCDAMTGNWKDAGVVRDQVVGNPACPSTSASSGVMGLDLINA